MISLKPITAANWQEAARLEVTPEQADFIEPNVWSIAESRFYDALTALAIFQNRTMVGFLMWGFSPEDKRPWLYRFMIDWRHQGQGIGKTALRLLLRDLESQGLPELNVGYHRDNLIAERLYLSLGFSKQGLAAWGELMCRMDF
ncbi:GNAT family N-acetyltransferase [soil metagenome]